MGSLSDKWLKDNDLIDKFYRELGLLIKERAALPFDFDAPQDTEAREIKNIDPYAIRIREKLLEMVPVTQSMMIQKKVQKIFKDSAHRENENYENGRQNKHSMYAND